MDSQLMTALQSGIEPVERPFAALAKRFGTSESEIVGYINDSKRSGAIRRFGAIFDSESLGFRSTLCAADIPEQQLASYAKAFDSMAGVTHVYLRDYKPALWFTFTARQESFAEELQELAKLLKPFALMELPALKKFKIRAVFGEGQEKLNTQQQAKRPASILKPNAQEAEMIRLLQGDIEISETPFAALAAKLGTSERELLTTLKNWINAGAIRRIGAVCRHQQLGYKGNAMCVWRVEPERLEAAGSALASFPEVSHCCQRRSFESFPYNLYGMLHAKDSETLERLFAELSGKLELEPGRMLKTKAELKKSSPEFF